MKEAVRVIFFPVFSIGFARDDMFPVVSNSLLEQFPCNKERLRDEAPDSVSEPLHNGRNGLWAKLKFSMFIIDGSDFFFKLFFLWFLNVCLFLQAKAQTPKKRP